MLYPKIRWAFRSLIRAKVTIGLAISGFPKRRNVLSLESFQDRIPALNDEIYLEEKIFDGHSTTMNEHSLKNSENIAKNWSCFPLYLRVLKNSSINFPYSIIYLKKSKKYLFEFSWGWGKYRTMAIGKFNRFISKKITSDYPVFLFCGSGYHGLIEDLPIVLILLERGANFTLAYDSRDKWTKGLIDFFVPEDVNLVEINDEVWVTSERFVVASKSIFGEFIHKELPLMLNSYVKKFNLEELKPRKIFIKRGNKSRRYNTNEQNYIETYQKKGYEIVSLEDLSIPDQISLFYNAKKVVGFHGAGLANIVWSRFDLELTELYTLDHFNSCYSSLCESLNFKYSNFEVSKN